MCLVNILLLRCFIVYVVFGFLFLLVSLTVLCKWKSYSKVLRILLKDKYGFQDKAYVPNGNFQNLALQKILNKSVNMQLLKQKCKCAATSIKIECNNQTMS